jgi:hypothetical protein
LPIHLQIEVMSLWTLINLPRFFAFRVGRVYNLHSFTLKVTMRLGGVIQRGCTVLSNYERRGLLPGQYVRGLQWIYLRIVGEVTRLWFSRMRYFRRVKTLAFVEVSVVNKMALGQVFFEGFGLQRQLSFHQFFTVIYPSTGTRTVWPVKATVPREQSDTPPRE